MGFLLNTSLERHSTLPHDPVNGAWGTPRSRGFARTRCALWTLLLLAANGLAGVGAADWDVIARAAMVREINETAEYAGQNTGRTRFDSRVMEVIGKVPRHRFVPDALQRQGYANRPLPIGHGQTISQPYIVALMTDLLNLGPESVVLEIGTGSGYQAAVLAELAARVYSVEIVESLGLQASRRLAALGYTNVQVRVADGYHGWPALAPFDAIIVTAAASHIPPPLVRQLRPGGVMVIPVGDPFRPQELVLVKKRADGKVTTRHILPVRFVPLTGRH